MSETAIMNSLFDMEPALVIDEGIHFFQVEPIFLGDLLDVLEDPCLDPNLDGHQYYPIHSVN